MGTYTIAFSANAGVCLSAPDVRVWIDALHREKQEEFSPVSPEIWAYMKKSPDFADPDVLCFTHCHNDHYSYGMTREARAIWPEAKVILPEFDFDDQILLTGEEVRWQCRDMSFRFVRTTHSGADSGKMPHYSILMDDGGTRIFFSGDITTPTPELEALLQGEPPDIALMPFTWATLIRGREFLAEVIRPRHLVLLHVPFEEDDVFHYRAAITKSLPKLEAIPDVRVLMRPRQVETVECLRTET